MAICLPLPRGAVDFPVCEGGLVSPVPVRGCYLGISRHSGRRSDAPASFSFYDVDALGVQRLDAGELFEALNTKLCAHT